MAEAGRAVRCNRYAQPIEIAQSVLCISSATQSSYVTGAALVVDGGGTA